MQTITRLIVGAVFCFSIVVAGCAAEYYVDGGSLGGPCSDDNPGTKERPWKTLARLTATNKTECPQGGDTVFVRSGTYRETLLIDRGGSPGRPLVLKAFPGEKPVIDGENKRYYGILIQGRGADHVVVEGFTLVNHRPAYSGGTGAIKVLDQADTVIRRADVSGAWCGIYLVNADDCQILESEIHHNAVNIAVGGHSRGILIADNRVHHSTDWDNISLGGGADSVMQMGRVASIEAAGPGLARFTVADTNNDGFTMASLNGRNADGKLKYPHTPVLFFLSEKNPSPDGPEIAGGQVEMMDGRKWFYMRNNPEWGGKPYSPDGRQGLFETGAGDTNELFNARYIYIGNTYDPANRFVRDVHILRNQVHHSFNQGILGPMTAGLLIKGNNICSNGCTGIQIETGARNIWIEGNACYANCTRSCSETGMWIDEIVDGVVQDNTVYENNRSVMVSQAQWIITRRNVIYNNRGQHVKPEERAIAGGSSGGFAFRGCGHRMLGAPRKTENCAFVHNTVYNCGATNSVWGTISFGVSPGYPKVGVNVFKNNLVQKNICPVTINLPYSDAPVLDGNIYYTEGPVKVRWSADKDTNWVISAAQGIEEYRKDTGQDVHSLVAEVKFIDPEKGNFRPAKGSVAIDFGQPLARAAADGAGTALAVDDIRSFSAGFRNSKGELLIPGDEIMIGGNKARVVEVKRAEKILVVDKSLSWKKDDPVGYLHEGAAPDVGALEYQPWWIRAKSSVLKF